MLPDVVVEGYSLCIREKGKLVGDRLGKAAFAKCVDALRKEAARRGRDPFGKTSTDEIKKKQWVKWLAEGSSAKSAIVNEAIDRLAADLSDVIRRFREADDEWRKVEAIAVGGGFSSSRIGRLTIARARRHLEKAGIDCDLSPIPQDNDIAGVCGAAYLAPSWMFAGFDAVIGVDIGGTNIRCGAVLIKTSAAGQVTHTKAVFPELWRHADDDPSRSEAIDELIRMLQRLVRKCRKKGVRLAPFIGVGCPGRVRPDGTLDRGAHTLPGPWESNSFNLPALIRDEVPVLKRQETIVVMHNDAVVQGLSQIPTMRARRNWAILSIGTGLGNAKFTTRHGRKKRGRKSSE